MDPLGIPAGAWHWRRDPAGHVQGFFGVNMRPDDFGRLGELLRRGGVWRGRRLLSARYVREATSATPTNGCYGWLIWVNAAAPCVGPTVSERPVEQGRDFPDLPADMYKFAGLFGQLVTVFPSQELVVVRTGQDPALAFAGGADWEHGLYRRVLDSIVGRLGPAAARAAAGERRADQPRLRLPHRAARAGPVLEGRGAGPAAARRPRPRPCRTPGAGTAACRPPRRRCGAPGVPGAMAVGHRPRLRGARSPDRRPRRARYSVAPGERTALRFRLRRARLGELQETGTLALTARARNRDRGGGTLSTLTFAIGAP